VIKHLKPKNYIIISFSDIPEKLSFQYLIEDNKINASFKDYNGNTIINFNEIKSIWVRRLNKLSIPQLKGSPRQYAMDEFNLLLNSIHKLFPNIKVSKSLKALLATI